MKKPPKDIEELTELKKYISEIPVLIEKLKGEIDAAMASYDICDEFEYQFSNSDLD
jgi:hypothetical protein